MSKIHFSIPPNGELVASAAQGTWVRAEGDGLPHPLYFRFSLADDGRMVATGLYIETERELTARDLRIPLAGILADFLAASAKPSTQARLLGELIPGLKVVFDGPVPDELPDAWKGLLSVPAKRAPMKRVRPGRRGHPAAHYKQLAQAYKRALRERPQAPIRALMDELHASEPTIHRWLRTARERGYLPAAEKRKETGK